MVADEESAALAEDWRRERPDIDMRSLHVFMTLRLVLQDAERQRARIFERHGVTPRTVDLLVALRRVGPPYMVTPSKLAQALVLTPGGVSQRLDRLEQEGLVRRTIDRDDRRVIWVQLTATGVKRLDDLMVEYMAHEEAMLAALSDADRKTLARLLAKLGRSVTDAATTDGAKRSQR
jgi:DNA-binding MarR family transcriptional regulator